MAISTASGPGKVNADINVTPMIDVMLVLLIIFMIVTPLLESGFQATAPQGSNVTKAAEEKDEITMGVDVQGEYYINKNHVPKDQAEGMLRTLFAAHTQDKRLYFKADAGLKYSVIQGAVETARRAGAAVLVAVTDHKGGLMMDDTPKGK